MLTCDQRAAAAKTLERRGGTVAVTLRHNVWPVSMDRIRRDIRTLHAHLDRRLFGRRFYRSRRRTSAWYVVEKLDCSPHLHGALLLRPDHAILFDAMMADGLWRRIGGIRSEYVSQQYCARWSEYATKSLTDMSSVIFSEDFHPEIT